MFLLSVFLLSLSTTSTTAMVFPRACVPQAHYPGTCCPSYMGSPCGSALNRGSCVPSKSSRAEPPPDITMDDRIPGFYFNVSCTCRGNFAGPDCGECKPGLEGDNCDRRSNHTRREVRRMNETERTLFLVQLQFCKELIDPNYVILRSGNRFRTGSLEFIDASYYDVWIFAMYYMSKPFVNNTRETNAVTFGAGGTGFLSTIRASVMHFERQMRRCLKDPSFTMYFYDWRDDNDCAMCRNDFFGASNDEGFLTSGCVFSTWRMCCADFDFDETYCLMSDCICERPLINRKAGEDPSIDKPYRADVDYCLSLRTIDAPPYNTLSTNCFRNCLEGNIGRTGTDGIYLNLLWHQYCGGTMSIPSIAPNDPLFILQATFLDRIFQAYIERWGITPASYPPTTMYGHRAYDCITPYYECWLNRDMFTSSINLGYGYDNF